MCTSAEQSEPKLDVEAHLKTEVQSERYLIRFERWYNLIQIWKTMLTESCGGERDRLHFDKSTTAHNEQAIDGIRVTNYEFANNGNGVPSTWSCNAVMPPASFLYILMFFPLKLFPLCSVCMAAEAVHCQREPPDWVTSPAVCKSMMCCALTSMLTTYKVCAWYRKQSRHIDLCFELCLNSTSHTKITNWKKGKEYIPTVLLHTESYCWLQGCKYQCNYHCWIICKAS